MAAEGGRVGVPFNKYSVNGFQNSIQIVIDVAVPKSENDETSTVEVFIADLIAGLVRLEIVLPPVDFDNEPMPQTDEVDDITSAWCLAAKMKSLGSPRSEVIPDLHLLRR